MELSSLMSPKKEPLPIFSDDPSYSWNSLRSGSSGTTGTLLLEAPDGAQTVLVPAKGQTHFAIQELPPTTLGQRYTFQIQNGENALPTNHFLGVAIIYQIP